MLVSWVEVERSGCSEVLHPFVSELQGVTFGKPSGVLASHRWTGEKYQSIFFFHSSSDENNVFPLDWGDRHIEILLRSI